MDKNEIERNSFFHISTYEALEELLHDKLIFWEDELSETLRDIRTDFRTTIYTLKKVYPDIDPELLESWLASKIEAFFSNISYNMFSSIYNELTEGGFWGTCKPRECPSCGQSCDVRKRDVE